MIGEESRSFPEWLEKLRTCSNSSERRAVLDRMEPLLEGLARAETDILFPILKRYLGFADWMQQAHIHHGALRELLGYAKKTTDHEHILEITDQIADRLASYLDEARRILYPRLTQALKPPELEILKLQLGRYWLLNELSEAA